MSEYFPAQQGQDPSIAQTVPPTLMQESTYARVYLACNVESLPSHLVVGLERNADPEDVDRQVLSGLAKELQLGDPEHAGDIIGSLYATARNIGDRRISHMSLEAFNFLDDSRSHARGLQFQNVDDGRAEVFELKREEEGMSSTPVLLVNMSELFPSREDQQSQIVVRQNLESLGVQATAEHITLLHAIKVVAHEAGHIVQLAAGQALQEQPGQGYNKYDVMSSRMLQLHPDIALSPNLHTSSKIHNERFAEGYSELVLNEVAKTLGYGEEETKKIIRAFGFERFDEPEAEFMSQVTEEKSLSQIAKEHSIDLYSGAMGYSMPLTPDQVVADLEAMNEYVMAKVEAGFSDVPLELSEKKRLLAYESVEKTGDQSKQTENKESNLSPRQIASKRLSGIIGKFLKGTQ